MSGTNIGTVFLSLAADPSQFNRQIHSSANGAGNAFATAFKSAFKAISVVAIINGLRSITAESIDLASDLTEVQNVVDTAFGDMAYKAEEFAKICIEQFGISELSAKQTASTFMAIGKGMDISGEAASDMAINLAKLGADVASFYNLNYEEASNKLKSVYTGETETLKSLGVVMTELNLKNYMLKKGYTAQYEELDAAEKATLRYNFVMDSLSLSIGDFEKTGDSWSNSTKKLKESLKSAYVSIGQVAIQYLTPVLQLLNEIVAAFGNVTSKIAQMAGIGVSDAVGEQMKAAANEVANSTEGIINTTKKQIEGLSSMDTFHTVNLGTGSDEEEGSGGTITPNMYYPESALNEQGNGVVNRVEQFFKNAFKDFQWFEFDFSGLENGFNKLLGPAKQLGGKIWDGITWAWNNVFKPFGEWAVNSGLPAFLEMVAAAIEVVDSAIEALKPTFSWLYDNILQPLLSFSWELIVDGFHMFRDALLGISDWIDKNGEKFRTLLIVGVSLVGAFIAAWKVAAIANWIQAAGGLVTVLSNIKTNLYAVTIAKLKDSAVNVGKTLKELALLTKAFILHSAELVKNAALWVVETAKKIASTAATVAHTAATWLATAATTAFGAALTFLTSPIGIVILAVTALIAIIVALIANWDKVKDAGTKAWENIKEKWNAAGSWIKTNVTEPIAKAFSNLFNNIKEAITTTFKQIVDNAINAITGFFSKIKNLGAKIGNFFFGGDSGGSVAVTNAPGYASGALIAPNQPHYAIVGDNTREREIISPVSTMADTFAAVLDSRLAGISKNNSTGSKVEYYTMEFEGAPIGEFCIDYINQKTKITGSNVIKLKK